MGARAAKIFKGTMTGILQYVLQVVLQIVLVPCILRFAGKDIMGAYAMIIQLIGYGLILDCGFGVAMNRYLARAFARDDGGVEFREVMSAGRTFLLATNALRALVLAVLCFYVGKLIDVSPALHRQVVVSLTLIAVWTVIRTPLSIYGMCLFATQHMSLANIITVFGNASRLLLSLALVLLRTSLPGLIVAYVLAEGLNFWLNRRYFKVKYPSYRVGWGIRDPILFKEMLRFGFQYWGINLAVLLFYGSDSLIVGRLFGVAAVSVYYTTKLPAFMFLQAVWKISDNASPATNELFAKSDYPALRTLYARLLKYSLLLAVPLGFGILCFNREIVAVWVGPALYAGDVMTWGLTVFIIAEILNHLNAMFVVASGEMKWWSSMTLLQGLVSAALAVFLGNTMGLQGVLVGFSLGCLLIVGYLSHKCLRAVRMKIKDLRHDVLAPVLTASLPFLVLFVLEKHIRFAGAIPKLIYLVPVFCGIWLAATFLFGLNGEERKYVIDRIHRQTWLRFQS